MKILIKNNKIRNDVKVFKKIVIKKMKILKINKKCKKIQFKKNETPIIQVFPSAPRMGFEPMRR